MPRASRRIRQCAECPKCLIRYLVGFSPYRNGSYLRPLVAGTWHEYILFCSCGCPFTASRWDWSEFKAYAVSKGAHDRGYGTPEEVSPVHGETTSLERQSDCAPNERRGSQ